MTATTSATSGVQRPRMWLTLPPGYVMTGVLAESERTEALARLTEGLSAPAARVVGEALEVAQQQAQALRSEHLTFSASGIHPREGGGVDLSSLVAGVVPVPRGPVTAILLAVARAEAAREDTDDVFVRDYPAGTAVVAERRIEAAGHAVGALPAEPEVSLRSIRVSFVVPGGTHLAVVELTSRSVDVFGSYRDVVLELVAPSVTFEDPATQRREEEEAGSRGRRVAERLGGRTVEVEGGARG